jgi:hypothetical protein
MEKYAMNKLSVFLMALSLIGFGGYAYAEVSQAEMDAITAECKQAYAGAVDPDILAENCVEEKLQALQEQSEQSGKEKS